MRTIRGDRPEATGGSHPAFNSALRTSHNIRLMVFFAVYGSRPSKNPQCGLTVRHQRTRTPQCGLSTRYALWTDSAHRAHHGALRLQKSALRTFHKRMLIVAQDRLSSCGSTVSRKLRIADFELDTPYIFAPPKASSSGLLLAGSDQHVRPGGPGGPGSPEPRERRQAKASGRWGRAAARPRARWCPRASGRPRRAPPQPRGGACCRSRSMRRGRPG